MSFVFFDTETTGTNLAFDQILQFAAIRTNEELVEQDEINVRCRLLPHVVASPEALLVNGTTANRLHDPDALTHYGMMRAIYAKLSEWSPSLFVGYNSLSFDEHLLRYAFYQTLHQPYLTSLNGNCRADALRLARFVCEFAPGCLTPAQAADGKPSFKLDHIASVNGFPREGAHDALDDVRATIHLCKIVMEKAPELWSSFTRFGQKRSVVAFIESDAVFGFCTFSGHVPSTYMLTALGPAPSYGAEYLAFDLSNEPAVVRAMSDEQLSAALEQKPYIVRRIRTNACPALLDAEIALPKSTASNIELAEVESRASELQQDEALKGRLIELSEKTRKPYPPSPHVEAKLYEGLIPDDDRDLFPTFHQASWEHRESIVANFQDRRLKQLARRLIYFERPDVLSEEKRRAVMAHIAERVVRGDDAETWVSIPRAIAQAEALMPSASELDRVLLAGHVEMWRRQLATFSQHLV